MCVESIESEVSQQRTSTVWKSEMESEIYVHVFVEKMHCVGMWWSRGWLALHARDIRCQNLFGTLNILASLPIIHTVMSNILGMLFQLKVCILFNRVSLVYHKTTFSFGLS